MQSIVLEPSILGAALRSANGASNALLREAAHRRIMLLITVPLWAEYRTVMMSAEERLAHGRLEEAIDRFLASVASAARAVTTDFQWRPKLSNALDEIVLQAAVMGRADKLVTLRPARFIEAGKLFGIDVMTPKAFRRKEQ